MKQVVKNYTINSGAKTITLTDYSTVLLERLYLITDVTNQTILYQFNTTAGVSVSGNVVTFTTLGVTGDSDKLQIIYDNQTGDPAYDTPVLSSGAATSANQTNGTQQAKITDGTNVVNVLKNDGTAGGQNAQMVAGTGMTTGTLTLNAGSPNTIWYDMLNYAGLSIEILTNTAPATLTFQSSGDAAQTNANTVYLTTVNGTAFAQVNTTTSASQNFYGQRTGRYFRVSSNVTGGNTATLVITFYTSPTALHNLQISQGQIGAQTATGSAVPANAFYQGISDGTNLVGVKTASAASATAGTGLLGAGVLGFDGTNYQRIKTDTSGNITTLHSDGTNVANVLKSDGTAAGQNAQLVASGYLSVAFTTTTVQAVGATDVGNYRWVSVHVTSQGTSSTVTYQGSNDNTNWVTAGLLTVSSTGGSSAVTSDTASGIIRSGPLNFRYFRLNVTGISAGTTAGVIIFSTQPASSNVVSAGVNQVGGWTVGSNSATGSAVPANAFYMGASDGTNLRGILTGSGSGDGGGAAALSTTSAVYNGSNWDRVRSATTAAATTGTGLLGAGILGFDGTNYQRIAASTGGVLSVSTTPVSTGGLSVASGSIGNTATAVKASAGQVYGYYFYNSNSTVVYVQFFNAATGSVTVGTTAPTYSLGIPPLSGANVSLPQGIAHSTAITVAITTTRAGGTSPSNTVDYNIYYA